MHNKLLVLQHVEWEKPGRLLLDAAKLYSVELRIVRTWEEPIPEYSDYDALILLGGQQNSNNRDINSHHPYIREEKQFLKTWLDLNKPCLGFSLGHELLAAAFQADIGPNFVTSIGFVEGYLTSNGTEHPLFKGISNPLFLFKWHDHAIQTPLPHDIMTLATSSQCVVEAFSIKGRQNIIGLQCSNYAIHPEDISLRLKKDLRLLKQKPQELANCRSIIRRAEKSLSTNRTIFTKLFKNFISFVNK